MPQTYHQLQKSIAELQAQAEGVKRSEVAAVIAQAKEAIKVYGLTRQDLFDAKTARATRGSRPARGSRGHTVKSSEPKYADGKGGVWVGRGKRPVWLSDLLKAGAKLEDFLVSKLSTSSPVTTSTEPAATPAVKKGAAKKTPTKLAAKKTAKARYQDSTGNFWSGFGPKPRWLREGIASGKKLEDFLA